MPVAVESWPQCDVVALAVSIVSIGMAGIWVGSFLVDFATGVARLRYRIVIHTQGFRMSRKKPCQVESMMASEISHTLK